MGQYFTPIFLNTAGTIMYALEPTDDGSGVKLFGHTRADTPLMAAVLTLLGLDGGFRMVWAGDYADPEPGASANLYFLTERQHFLRFEGLVAGDVQPNTTLPAGAKPDLFGYVCNLDKRQYIQNWALPVDDTGWRRTPLPRLLADGGPAYRDPVITTWSRDRIYYSQRHPGPDWTAIK
jgi:hypothetical protein